MTCHFRQIKQMLKKEKKKPKHKTKTFLQKNTNTKWSLCISLLLFIIKTRTSEWKEGKNQRNQSWEIKKKKKSISKTQGTKKTRVEKWQKTVSFHNNARRHKTIHCVFVHLSSIASRWALPVRRERRIQPTKPSRRHKPIRHYNRKKQTSQLILSSTAFINRISWVYVSLHGSFRSMVNTLTAFETRTRTQKKREKSLRPSGSLPFREITDPKNSVVAWNPPTKVPL